MGPVEPKIGKKINNGAKIIVLLRVLTLKPFGLQNQSSSINKFFRGMLDHYKRSWSYLTQRCFKSYSCSAEVEASV